MPASRWLRGLSRRVALVLSTMIAAAGVMVMATPLGFAGVCVDLALAGWGSSIQHLRGSLPDAASTWGAIKAVDRNCIITTPVLRPFSEWRDTWYPPSVPIR